MGNVRRRRAIGAAAGCVAAATLASAAGSAVTARPAGGPPKLRSAPVVNGRPWLGKELTASHGDWYGGGPLSFRYQWLRCRRGVCSTIGGARLPVHTADVNDVGTRLRVDVTATNRSGSAVARTAPTELVQGDATLPTNVSPPRVDGIPQSEGMLTAFPGRWTGTGPLELRYAWLRCPSSGAPRCTPIPRATRRTYVPRLADVARRLRVSVQARNDAGTVVAFTPVGPLIGPARFGDASVAAADVLPPDTLVISPAGVRRRADGGTTVRVLVTELSGLRVVGAAVDALALPHGRARPVGERRTAANGIAALELPVVRRLPRATLLVFVRARRPRDGALASVSTGRLVRVRLAR